MYISDTISIEKSQLLIQNKDWEYICEQHSTHGTNECYWNRKTGELLWISEEDNRATYSKRQT